MPRPQSNKISQMKYSTGFTLVEVMIAMVVFIIGVLAVAALHVTSIRGNASASSFTEATTHAGDWIETLMTLPYNDGRLQDGSGTGDGVNGLNDTVDNGGADFSQKTTDMRYTIDTNIADNAAVVYTKTIRVIVTWDDGNQRRKASFDVIKPMDL